jgi:hypothetical protein
MSARLEAVVFSPASTKEGSECTTQMRFLPAAGTDAEAAGAKTHVTTSHAAMRYSVANLDRWPGL